MLLQRDYGNISNMFQGIICNNSGQHGKRSLARWCAAERVVVPQVQEVRLSQRWSFDFGARIGSRGSPLVDFADMWENQDVEGQIYSGLIREPFTAESLRNDWEADFSVKLSDSGPKVGVTVQSVGVTRATLRVTAGQTPRIRTESPRKGARRGFRCFYRSPPLEPSWIHLKYNLLLIMMSYYMQEL